MEFASLQYLDALLSKYPSLADNQEAIDKLCRSIKTAGQGLFGLPPTPVNLAEFVISMANVGLDDLVVEASKEYFIDSQEYLNVVAFVNLTKVHMKEDIEDLRDRVERGPYAGTNRGGTLFVSGLTENLSYLATIDKAAPKTINELLLIAPLFFLKK